MEHLDKTVLFIDDEQDILNNYKALYEDDFKAFHTFQGGAGAVERALELNPDCIICDINMPHLNGYDILIKLREANYHKPIIFYTGHAQLDDKTLKQLDHIAVINKTDIDFLEETLNKVLS